jgi:hypothetical protein
VSRERPRLETLRARIEGAIDELRQQLLRYELEVDPDSAYVLSDYLDALRLDAREAAERGDADALAATFDDVRQLQSDTVSRLDPGRGSSGRHDGSSDDAG